MKNGTFVSQGKYIKDMLKKFGMDDAKSISTSMGTNGSLLYVTASRPDAMFSVCMRARFQASPRETI